jgi:uncharacterized protein (TIGR00297 family)
MYTDSGLLLALLFFTLLITIGSEWFSRKNIIPYWLSRKILHFTVISLCAVVPLLVSNLNLLIGIVCICEIILLVLVAQGILFKEEDGRRSWGIALFPPAYLILLMLFRNEVWIIGFSMAILAVCDASAAVAGNLYKKSNPSLQKVEKTVAGNTFFLLSGLGLYLVNYKIILHAFSFNGNFLVHFAEFFYLLFLLMLVEHLGRRGWDNFWLPLASALLITCTNRLNELHITGIYFLLPAIAVVFIYFSIKKNLLSRNGAYAAALSGLTVIYFGGIKALLPLLLFFLSSAFIGRIYRNTNENTDSKSGAARDEFQVFANGGIFILLIILSNFLDESTYYLAAFASIAISTADTWSSEIGMGLRGKTIDIIRRKKVPSGLSGGISFAGSLAGLAGALSVAGLYLLVVESTNISSFLLITGVGFTGMLVDSILGSLLQVKFFNEKNAAWSDKNAIDTGKASTMKGIIWMTNDMVNLLSNVITIVGLLALIAFSK